MHHVEQDEELAREGDRLAASSDIVAQLFALEVLHHDCLGKFGGFVDYSVVLGEEIGAGALQFGDYLVLMGYFLYFPRLYFGDFHGYNFIDLFQVGQLPLEIDGADKAHPNLADMNEAGAAIANWSIFGDFLDCFYFY